LKQLLNGVSRWQRALVAFIDNGRVLQLAEVKEGEVRPSQTGKRRTVGNGPIVARAGWRACGRRLDRGGWGADMWAREPQCGVAALDSI
jgi:hypothetical protein